MGLIYMYNVLLSYMIAFIVKEVASFVLINGLNMSKKNAPWTYTVPAGRKELV